MKKTLYMIIASALCAGALAGCGQSQASSTGYIGVNAAKNAALSASQVSLEGANFSQAELSEENGTMYYDVDFVADGMEYSYAVDAVTGAIIEEKKEPTESAQTTPSQQVQADSAINTVQPKTTTPQQQTTTSGAVDEAKAKQIALSHAGVSESDTSFLVAKKDYDDGVEVYDVEFYVASSNTEYDYEINASTGEIISFDYDAENYTPNTNSSSNTGTAKTEQEIIAIALAKVPGATESDIRMSLDRDDGKLRYEGKIVYQQTEYDFEIDAYSGAIVEWEAESIFD